MARNSYEYSASSPLLPKKVDQRNSKPGDFWQRRASLLVPVLLGAAIGAVGLMHSYSRSGPNSCPPGFSSFGQRCLNVVGNKLNHLDAVRFCSSQFNASLANVSGANMEIAILGFARHTLQMGVDLWVAGQSGRCTVLVESTGLKYVQLCHTLNYFSCEAHVGKQIDEVARVLEPEVTATREVHRSSAVNRNSCLRTKTSKLMCPVAPKIFQRPVDGNVTISLGSTFVLHCNASGNPVPKVRWSTPSESSIYSEELDPRLSHSLVVEKAQHNNLGKYACIAVNGINPDAVAFFNVTVLKSNNGSKHL